MSALRLWVPATLILIASVGGCGKKDATGPRTPIVASIAVTPGNTTLISLGETVQLDAAAREANGTTIPGKSFAWSSSDEAVARVTDSGEVTSMANGSVTITASTEGRSGTAGVQVVQGAASLSLSATALALDGPGSEATITATVMDAGGSEIADPSLTWTSDDEGIATVKSTGLVTAVAVGVATVTAQVDAGGQILTQQVAVTVNGSSAPCTGDTGTVTVSVGGGLRPTFDWDPPCAVAMLLVESSVRSDVWGVATGDLQELTTWDDPSANRIMPPVTWGVVPLSASEFEVAQGPMEAGVTHDVILWRVVAPGSTVECLQRFANICGMAIYEFSQVAEGSTGLVFTTQPTETPVGSPIEPSVRVVIQDWLGVAVTTATNDVTVELLWPDATLSGTTTVAAVEGVAIFDDLTIDRRGWFLLRATAAGLTGATSAEFKVTEPE